MSRRVPPQSRRRRPRPTARAGAALAGLALLVAACGFEPVYLRQDTDSGAMAPMADLAAIEVVSPPDREGQILHNYLLDRLNPQGPPDDPLYRLTTDISVAVQGLGVRADATTSRNRVEVTAQSTLTGAGDAHDFTARATSSFNTTQSDYATIVAEEEAIDRTLRVVADELQLKLAAFFRKARARK